MHVTDNFVIVMTSEGHVVKVRAAVQRQMRALKEVIGSDEICKGEVCMYVLSAEMRDRQQMPTELCEDVLPHVDIVFKGKDFDTLISLSGSIKEEMLRQHDREGGCRVTMTREDAHAHVRQAFTSLQYVFVELLGLHRRITDALGCSYRDKALFMLGGDQDTKRDLEIMIMDVYRRKYVFHVFRYCGTVDVDGHKIDMPHVPHIDDVARECRYDKAKMVERLSKL